MSQNPFDALGGDGGMDMNSILQQAQQMQQQLQDAQSRLAEAEVEGSVAGGAVSVSVTGMGELSGVRVRPGSFDGQDEESLSELGDMVVAAYRDAKAQADRMAGEALGPLAGGMGAGGLSDGGLGDLGAAGDPGGMGGGGTGGDDAGPGGSPGRSGL